MSDLPPGCDPVLVEDWFDVLNHIETIAPRAIYFRSALPAKDQLLIELSNGDQYMVSMKRNPTLEEAAQGAETHHPVFVDAQYKGEEAVAYVERLIKAFGSKVE